MAFEHDAKVNETYGPGRVVASAAALRQTLEEAQELAVQIERILSNPRADFAEADAFRVRLARAHTLSLLDQLSELLGPEESASRQAFRDDDTNVVSGIRPAWR